MSGTLRADHPAFRAAIADVHRTADHLRAARDHVGREVEALLDGGWRGPAATAFAEGWDDWQRSAGDVLDGLVAMGRLLDAVHADLVESDLTSRVRLEQVTGRIVARLG